MPPSIGSLVPSSRRVVHSSRPVRLARAPIRVASWANTTSCMRTRRRNDAWHWVPSSASGGHAAPSPRRTPVTPACAADAWRRFTPAAPRPLARSLARYSARARSTACAPAPRCQSGGAGRRPRRNRAPIPACERAVRLPPHPAPRQFHDHAPDLTQPGATNALVMAGVATLIRHRRPSRSAPRPAADCCRSRANTSFASAAAEPVRMPFSCASRCGSHRRRRRRRAHVRRVAPARACRSSASSTSVTAATPGPRARPRPAARRRPSRRRQQSPAASPNAVSSGPARPASPARMHAVAIARASAINIAIARSACRASSTSTSGPARPAIDPARPASSESAAAATPRHPADPSSPAAGVD